MSSVGSRTGGTTLSSNARLVWQGDPPTRRSPWEDSFNDLSRLGAYVNGVASFLVSPKHVPNRSGKASGVTEREGNFLVRILADPCRSLGQRRLIRGVGVGGDIGPGEGQG